MKSPQENTHTPCVSYFYNVRGSFGQITSTAVPQLLHLKHGGGDTGRVQGLLLILSRTLSLSTC